MGESLVIGIHGQPGAGKTTLAATAAPHDKMLWLSFDHAGTDSLGAKGIDVDIIDVPGVMRTTGRPIDDVVAKALGEAEKLFKAGKKTHLVIDTLSTYANSRLNALMSKEEASGKPNKYKPYSDIAREMEALLRVSISFAPNIIVCMHSKFTDADAAENDTKVKNEASRGMAHIVADIPGRAGLNAVFGCMSMVLYCQVGEENVGGKKVATRQLIDSSTIVQVKNRFAGIVPAPLPMNLASIIEAVKGKQS
jgi:hypothetical protein